MSSLVLITPPASEPVSLAEVKLQLGIGPLQDSDHVISAIEVSRLRGMITAARTACEDYLRQALITQTWELRLDGFPGFNTRYNRDGYPQIWIPRSPFQSIVSFQYVDVGGVLQTLTLDTTYGVNDPDFYSYQLDSGSQSMPARVLPAYARPWPPTRLVANNVILRFIAGYGDTASAVPAPILTAIRYLVHYFYKQDGKEGTELPTVVMRLLDPYRNLLS